jgi:hypothetical protein
MKVSERFTKCLSTIFCACLKGAVIFLSKLGRGLSLFILRKINAKNAKLGSKKAGLSSDFWENCMILKKISIGKRPSFGVCYTSRKITEGTQTKSTIYCIFLFSSTIR